MRNPCFKGITLMAAMLAVTACASSRPPPDRLIDEIYDDVHRSGAQEAVEGLRRAMGERQVYGVNDPYVPMRTPDEVVPIWVPAYEDPRTGRRVEGHWEHTVLRRGEWFTD